jgi:dipeptide/tripeptide permease
VTNESAKTSGMISNDTAASARHPKGLSALFFTEMWERLGFYIIVGILVLYLTDSERGGLGMPLKAAAEIYGTYMAFVYFTPFLGGLIADRYLGYRVAVLIGGLLLAAGYFLIGIRSEPALYGGLILVCLGNGLFKPNITAMVGNLYSPGDPKRDAGFNIFYMGINIGACLSALLSAPLRNEWNYNAAFIGAGIGLLVGVANLLWNWQRLKTADRKPEVDPRDVSLIKIMMTILVPAAAVGMAGYFLAEGFKIGGIEHAGIAAIKASIKPVTFAFLVAMLPIAFYFLSLVLRASPDERPGLTALLPVYLAGGAFFMILHLNGGLITLFAEERTNRSGDWVPDFLEKYYCQKAMPSYFGNADPSLQRTPEEMLVESTRDLEAMFGARRISESALAGVLKDHADIKSAETGDPIMSRVAPEWAFLTQNVYREDQLKIETAKDSHGIESTKVRVVPDTAESLRKVILLREENGELWPVMLVSAATKERVFQKASDKRLRRGQFSSLLNAELIANFLNPLFVVLMTPIVVAFLGWRVRAGKGISTARKILYGMLITVVALLVMACAAYMGSDGASKVSVLWIVLFYVVITVGELLLSPMGLSLVTKLSPKRFVGLMLGGWFVSTAVGNKLSGFISGLEPTTKMFVVLSIALFAVAMVILALQPMLNRAIKKYGA